MERSEGWARATGGGDRTDQAASSSEAATAIVSSATTAFTLTLSVAVYDELAA